MQIMCGDEHMLSVWACIADGTVCSNHGRCVDNQCACFSGYGGTYCDQAYQPSSSSDNLAVILVRESCSSSAFGLYDVGLGRTLRLILMVVVVGGVLWQGVVIPVSVALCLLLLCLILAVVCFTRLSRRKREEWNLNWDELEMGEALGMGGYGEVFKAKWRGTEVAVKMVASKAQVTKEMQKNFADEIHVMTTLRHPNVVLFMAASTKPPKMCIVMEFMALGSLYDVRFCYTASSP
jgi:preprotein translocase subunit YajC